MDEAAQALRVLLAYMKAMTAWEQECLKLDEKCESGKMEWSDLKARQLKKLNALQDKWCTVSKWRRDCCMYGWPADYDPQINKFLRMEWSAKDKMILEMQQTAGAKLHIRMQLEKVGDDWKVARRWFLEYKTKKPVPLNL